jgi:hypothetical protein
MTNVRSALLLGSMICAFAVSEVQATTITFNFDGLGNNADSAVIQAYMSSVLQAQGFGPNLVTVTGGIGQQGASSYAGEGFVVGPKTGSTVNSLTLADTNNSATPNTTTSNWDSNPPSLSNSNTDGFIKNCTSADPALSTLLKTGCGGASADIFISFGALVISSAVFDFEIFPDGSCPSLSNCGTGQANKPDLELWTGANGTGTSLGTWFGVAPGTGGTYPDSPNDPNGETAPQLLGVSGAIAMNTSTLDFKDWPETIGIDNLTITLPPHGGGQGQVPEPSTLWMLAFGLAGLGFARRKLAS